MAVRRTALFWMILLFLAFSAGSRGENADGWTVERFSGDLSGQTVTVTRKLWEDGALAREETAGPLRPEMVFALRCMRAELPDRALTVNFGAGNTAYVIPPDRETGEWLLENAWRFGLTATLETEETRERLFLRYVGPVHAAAMRSLDMDLREYLLFLRQEGRAALYRNGRTAAWIFCVPAEEAVTFTLPEDAAWEISGDGDGSVIIVLRAAGEAAKP